MRNSLAFSRSFRLALKFDSEFSLNFWTINFLFYPKIQLRLSVWYSLETFAFELKKISALKTWNRRQFTHGTEEIIRHKYSNINSVTQLQNSCIETIKYEILWSCDNEHCVQLFSNEETNLIHLSFCINAFYHRNVLQWTYF